MYGLWKRIWKVKAPTKVGFFVWLAALGKVLTMYLLQRKGILIANWCCMCKENRDPWMLVLCLFEVHRVMLKRVVDLLAYWKGRFVRHCNVDIWNAIPLCIMWTIWKERNYRVFEDVERSTMVVKQAFLKSLYEWMVLFSSHSFSSILDLIDCCNFL